MTKCNYTISKEGLLGVHIPSSGEDSFHIEETKDKKFRVFAYSDSMGKEDTEVVNNLREAFKELDYMVKNFT